MAAQTSYDRAPALGIVGQLADTSPNDCTPMRNDEATAAMPPGFAISRASTSDPASGDILTAITGEIVAGIVVHYQRSADQVDSDGAVLAGQGISVLRKGRILVTCEDGCSVGDRLHIRAVTSGAEVAGALLASADGTDTIDSTTQGVWRTSAAAGGLAILEVDFSREL